MYFENVLVILLILFIPCYTAVHLVHKKSKPKVFFDIGLEIVHKFPSNLAGSCINQCQTFYQAYIHTYTLHCNARETCDNNTVISHSLQQIPTQDIRRKKNNYLPEVSCGGRHSVYGTVLNWHCRYNITILMTVYRVTADHTIMHMQIINDVIIWQRVLKQVVNT